MLNKLIVVAALALSTSANASVVVVGNPSMDALSAATVKKLYLGKAKSLNIDVVDLADGDALKEEFHQKVTGKTEAQLQAYWAKRVFTGKGQPPKALPNADLVKNTVQTGNNIIGYIDETQVDSSVKVLLKP
ncbi:phosphate ABC transporter substrate-binding protein [Vibrio sp. vnigr-6D03]|uniref:phosphate ABC transporter substrate-binding protein n=1 Tax=Vibrio sp. vnigr-6D03 TaxID=2058088 RepID=UPI000C341E0B|nr:phosphate ABC transporter substrate-binding protein [Vibrio sp. vnigr-6D03]PKF76540.1 phosphate ABC transporter substrate-binding protein [Vibrio sp. vnigr-6D03]